MKIYEIGTGYTPIPAQVSAATESVVEELTKAYIQIGQPVEIIDISASGRAENSLPITEVAVPAAFRKSDVSLGIVHKLKRVVYSVALAFKLKKILKCQKESVVLHFHNQYNLFFFTKLVPGKFCSKAIIAYTNHNGMWSLPWDEVKDTLHNRYFQEIEAMKRADIVFVLNGATKKNVETHLKIKPEKVICISNGVNTDVYRPLNSKDRVKEKYSLCDKRVILQVGSVYENKGQARVLNILAPLLKENKDLIYAFAGSVVSQEYFDTVNRLAEELDIKDRVIYLGSLTPGASMNEIYNLADVTVFASDYEGFPLVCIESISAGVPVVVCSDLPVDIGNGTISVIAENAKHEIEEQIFNNTDNYKTLCERARQNAAENYSWQKVAKDYLGAFEAIKR